MLEFLLVGNSVERSRVLSSDNRWVVSGYYDETSPSGWARLDMNNKLGVDANSGQVFKGLPLTGFAVVQYTHAGAQAGLLAQYGALFKNQGIVEPVNTD